MAGRPALQRMGWTTRDFAKRVWDNSGEDNVFFLAGGIAFNILLAAIPFFLLLISGLAYIFNQSTDASLTEVAALVDRLLPPGLNPGQLTISNILGDIVKARGSLGVYSAIGFVWFSTRLFGSLRSVLAEVFDIESERGIVEGKLFDIKVTVLSTVLVAAYTVLSAYLAFATSRGVALLGELGVRQDVMGQVGYWVGRLVAFGFIVAMFFSLYKLLPKRRIRWPTALIAALFTSTLFEAARNLYTAYVENFNPGSLYSGTLYALVTVVFWVYYAAFLFILGGEVAQVYELRRVRRLQRTVLDVPG
ncbi:MAG TPA: YihY/virulence factor BrkB family protein [Gemmatimonadaceae bacterium]|jgi:membrane protein|nr:YihY/virulence factor BrkB family protein [Gemmatimonadaceae bacterium]